jgi:hypothetical protein
VEKELWNIKGSHEFWDALDQMPSSVQNEFAKEAVLQLQADPYLTGERFEVLPSPDPDRNPDIWYLYLVNNPVFVAYRVVDAGHFISLLEISWITNGYVP